MSIQPVATNRTMRSIALPLAGWCIVLMLILGGGGYIVVRLDEVVSCTNTTLANRSGPTLDFAHHLYLETKIHNPTPAQRVQLQRSTAKAIKRWYFQLLDNPLGQC